MNGHELVADFQITKIIEHNPIIKSYVETNEVTYIEPNEAGVLFGRIQKIVVEKVSIQFVKHEFVVKQNGQLELPKFEPIVVVRNPYRFMDFATELIRLIFSFAKFNTKLFLTCKTLFNSTYRVKCITGKCDVDRKTLTDCPCIEFYRCHKCTCKLMPQCFPTKCQSFLLQGRVVRLFTCDNCHVKYHTKYNSKTYAFNVRTDGTVNIQVKSILQKPYYVQKKIRGDDGEVVDKHDDCYENLGKCNCDKGSNKHCEYCMWREY